MYEINAVLCTPLVDKHPDIVQLLLHGAAYNNQYWTMPTTSFTNYSYSDYSCERGLTSFAYDSVGAGLSTIPVNPSDIQLIVASTVASQLGHSLKNGTLYPTLGPRKVVGVGHSVGSLFLNFAAIVDGATSPFSSLLLTGWRHVHNLPAALLADFIPAAVNDPVRWGGLDLNYITTITRAIVYPSNPLSFSPRLLALDEITKDIVSSSAVASLAAGNFSAIGYGGSVLEFCGTEDGVVCAGSSCEIADVPAITLVEKPFFPDSRNVTFAVSPGSGHDLNFDFFAEFAFSTMLQYSISSTI